MPLNLYRRTSTGAELAVDHPLFHLLHNAPNNWQTSTEVREAMILDVLCFGQSFIEKEFDRNGISALYPLSAGRMVFMNPLDMFIPPPVPLFYRYADPRVGQRILMSDDLWRCSMLGPASTVEGQSLILLAREAIGLALAAEEQGARLFSQGIQSDMQLTIDGEMDEDGKKQLREAFMRRPFWVRPCLDATTAGGRSKGQPHRADSARIAIPGSSAIPARRHCPHLPHSRCTARNFTGQVIHLRECRAILPELCQIHP